jgi:predicted dehydrogenase
MNSLRLRIYGDKGGLEVDLDSSRTQLKLCRGSNIHEALWETIDCPVTPNNYQRFVDSIKSGVNDQPNFRHGAKIQRLIDGCFESDRLNQPIKL